MNFISPNNLFNTLPFHLLRFDLMVMPSVNVIKVSEATHFLLQRSVNYMKDPVWQQNWTFITIIAITILPDNIELKPLQTEASEVLNHCDRSRLAYFVNTW